jgi:sugar phosphate isomerase/epimerase
LLPKSGSKFDQKLIKISEGYKMKLGLMTAAFPGKSLEEVAGWAAKNGFEALEPACWPVMKADRRYAGVTTIDVSSLDQQGAKEIHSVLKDHGLVISSLGYYPNPLHPDPEHRNQVIEHLKKVIDAAELLEVPIVGTVVGRDKDKNVVDNLEEYARVWPPIVQYARQRGVKIAIENCPMLFSNDEWPGGVNLASTPTIWRKMWEIIPDETFGLNLDPSHLIWLMIDPQRWWRAGDHLPRMPRICASTARAHNYGTLSLGAGRWCCLVWRC